jgi:hypothetical protein
MLGIPHPGANSLVKANQPMMILTPCVGPTAAEPTDRGPDVRVAFRLARESDN